MTIPERPQFFLALKKFHGVNILQLTYDKRMNIIRRQ
jgi:hypothetical protein